MGSWEDSPSEKPPYFGKARWAMVSIAVSHYRRLMAWRRHLFVPWNLLDDYRGRHVNTLYQIIKTCDTAMQKSGT